MVVFRQKMLFGFLLLAAMFALLLFISSLWLLPGDFGRCGGAWQPCFYHKMSKFGPARTPGDWVEHHEGPPLIRECAGQSFQVWRLLENLKSSLAKSDDILLEPYLQSWDQLLNFMESLGTVVSFFSQELKEKIVLMRQLPLKHSTEVHGEHIHEAFRSVQSMVEAELKVGVVNFSQRTDSGCRTLLRLHRSLLWLKLMLEGLAEGPDSDGRYKTPGELSSDAYKVALAPHHPWFLRQAAELVFLALPDRQYFLRLVCVHSQEEALPVLHAINHALTQVHTQTQRILAERNMLELP